MHAFRDEVYRVVKQIPRGKVATYGQIARLASSPNAARAVGQIMKRNQHPERIPCHRVVGAQGALTGYAFNGIGEKRKKLLAEGIAFKGKCVDLNLSLWQIELTHPVVTGTEYK
jgi:methylated-DNA-protein-cysteine methyltransferase-like protein